MQLAIAVEIAGWSRSKSLFQSRRDELDQSQPTDRPRAIIAIAIEIAHPDRSRLSMKIDRLIDWFTNNWSICRSTCRSIGLSIKCRSTCWSINTNRLVDLDWSANRSDIRLKVIYRPIDWNIDLKWSINDRTADLSADRSDYRLKMIDRLIDQLINRLIDLPVDLPIDRQIDWTIDSNWLINWLILNQFGSIENQSIDHSPQNPSQLTCGGTTNSIQHCWTVGQLIDQSMVSIDWSVDQPNDQLVDQDWPKWKKTRSLVDVGVFVVGRIGCFITCWLLFGWGKVEGMMMYGLSLAGRETILYLYCTVLWVVLVWWSDHSCAWVSGQAWVSGRASKRKTIRRCYPPPPSQSSSQTSMQHIRSHLLPSNHGNKF